MGTETCPSPKGVPKSPKAAGAWIGKAQGAAPENRWNQHLCLSLALACRWGEETLPDGRTLKYWVSPCAAAVPFPQPSTPPGPILLPLLMAPPHSQTAANSWGPAWGERGHFRIMRGANECDIESFVLGVWGRVGMEDMNHH